MARVHLPDGRIVNFPDGMSEQDMAKAMDEIHAPTTQAAAPAASGDERSLGGFLGNVATSGGRFVRDAASGLVDMGMLAGKGMLAASGDTGRGAELVSGAAGLARNAPRMLSVAGSALKNRYGGLEQIKNTLYNDPVGVAADVSMLLDPAAGLAKAGGLAKTAGALSRGAELTNPMRAIGSAIEPVTHGIANTAVRATLRAPANVRSEFGGGKAIADAVLKDRVYSSAGAQRKLSASVAEADNMLAAAQAAGTPGVPRIAVARSVLGEPKATAQLRTRLGVPDQTPDLTGTAKAIFHNNPSQIPLTDAQAMKREAQKLAHEANTDNLSIKHAAETAKAQALRAGIEARVPAVAPVNERSQRLIGSQRAFEAAEDRPRSLNTMLAIGAGGIGYGAGGPSGAAVMSALMKAADSPRLGALTGIGVNEFGRGMNAQSLRKAALVARLLDQVPDDEQ